MVYVVELVRIKFYKNLEVRCFFFIVKVVIFESQYIGIDMYMYVFILKAKIFVINLYVCVLENVIIDQQLK